MAAAIPSPTSSSLTVVTFDQKHALTTADVKRSLTVEKYEAVAAKVLKKFKQA